MIEFEYKFSLKRTEKMRVQSGAILPCRVSNQSSGEIVQLAMLCLSAVSRKPMGLFFILILKYIYSYSKTFFSLFDFSCELVNRLM